jgi:hypothetical protein
MLSHAGMTQAGGVTLPLASVLPVIGPPVKFCDEGDPPPTTASEDGDDAELTADDAATAKTMKKSTTRSRSGLDICTRLMCELNRQHGPPGQGLRQPGLSTLPGSVT